MSALDILEGDGREKLEPPVTCFARDPRRATLTRSQLRSLWQDFRRSGLMIGHRRSYAFEHVLELCHAKDLSVTVQHHRGMYCIERLEGE